jgi:outer membrane protein OmpA-like peptidoglycan-associated protein
MPIALFFDSRRLRVLFAPLLASLLLAGCADIPPAPTQERDLLSPPRPAVRQQSPDWPGLQRELEAVLREISDNRIARLPEGLRASLPAADGFASGRVEIRPPLAALLQRVAPVLQRHAWAGIRIVCHTDGLGSEMNNLDLSFRRAEAVVEYLRQQGVALDRLSADGRGEAEPLADNAKAEGRARNKRIEIFLNPR